jgi:hypothetical protein
MKMIKCFAGVPDDLSGSIRSKGLGMRGWKIILLSDALRKGPPGSL